MYQPNYTLTPAIASALQNIEGAGSALERMSLPSALHKEAYVRAVQYGTSCVGTGSADEPVAHCRLDDRAYRVSASYRHYVGTPTYPLSLSQDWGRSKACSKRIDSVLHYCHHTLAATSVPSHYSTFNIKNSTFQRAPAVPPPNV